jgi:hypothetical protein
MDLAHTARRFDRWFFILGAIGSFAVAIALVVGALRFLSKANYTLGTVIAIQAEEDSETGTMFRAKLAFDDAAGWKHTFSDEGAYFPSPYEIGESIAVAYEADRPDSAKIYTIWGVWWEAIVALVLGVGFVAGYFLQRRFWRSQRAGDVVGSPPR